MITSYLEVAAGGHSFLLASGMIREVWQAAYALWHRRIHMAGAGTPAR